EVELVRFNAASFEEAIAQLSTAAQVRIDPVLAVLIEPERPRAPFVIEFRQSTVRRILWAMLCHWGGWNDYERIHYPLAEWCGKIVPIDSNGLIISRSNEITVKPGADPRDSELLLLGTDISDLLPPPGTPAPPDSRSWR